MPKQSIVSSNTTSFLDRFNHQVLKYIYYLEYHTIMYNKKQIHKKWKSYNENMTITQRMISPQLYHYLRVQF